ncbi:MAG: sugar phosphate isomerase/epimerase, partial [Cyclobacteriaceae bacterium]
MLQVGIFTGYFPYSLEETAGVIRNLGFNTVQLDLIFKDMDLSTENINKGNCTKIRDTFRKHNLPVSCISSYTNIIHPDPAKRDSNIKRLKKIIQHAHDLGSPYIPVETGTYHEESDWIHHPKNKTEEGYAECRDVIRDLVRFARDHGAVFIIEPYVNNVIGSVDEVLRLFSDIDDDCLGLAMDPVNYFDVHNIGNMDGTLNNIFDRLSEKVKFAHAKDVKLADSEKGVQMAEIYASEGHSFRGVGRIEQPAAGLGILNYDLYLQRLAKDHPNLPIIIEHLEEEDVPRAKSFLDEKLMANGV